MLFGCMYILAWHGGVVWHQWASVLAYTFVMVNGSVICYAMLCYQSAGFASFFLVAFVFFRPFAYGWTYALTGEICYDMIDD